MSNVVIEIVLAGGAIVAAIAVGVTCLLGLAVWLSGACKDATD